MIIGIIKGNGLLRGNLKSTLLNTRYQNKIFYSQGIIRGKVLLKGGDYSWEYGNESSWWFLPID